MTTTQRKTFATECQRRRDEGLKLFGGYDIREQIKQAGGIWDKQIKAWLVPDEDVALTLGAREATGRYGRYFVMKASGAAQTRPSRRSSGRGECVECGEWGAVGETCRECHEGYHA